MKAIVVKYHGPTANRPTRLIARDSDGNQFTQKRVSPRVEFDYHLAAKGLAEKMNWDGVLVAGHLDKGRMVYVWLGGSERIVVNRKEATNQEK